MENIITVNYGCAYSFVVYNYCYVPPGIEAMSHVRFVFKPYFYFVNTPLFQWRWWPYSHYL
jgi:hypothetical protein